MKISLPSTLFPSQNLSNTSISSRPGQENTYNSQPLFAMGQIIQARVLAIGPDALATLEVDGQKLIARSFVQLEVGRTLWMEVCEPGPPPQLVSAGQKGMAQELIRFLIDARQAGPLVLPHLEALQKLTTQQEGQAFPELTRLVSLLGSLTTDKSPAPERVALLIAWLESGRRGEKPVFPAPLSQELSELVTVLRQRGKISQEDGVEHLDALQKSARLLNCLAEGSGSGPLLGGERQEWFLYPCIFAESAGWGEWFVELPNRRAVGGGTEDFSISFFLTMSKLGEMALQISAGKQALYGTFKVASEEVRQDLASGIPELSQTLESLGFKPVQLSSITAPVSYVRELREKLIDKTAQQSFSLFNVRV